MQLMLSLHKLAALEILEKFAQISRLPRPHADLYGELGNGSTATSFVPDTVVGF
jgi:hypothetical protein